MDDNKNLRPLKNRDAIAAGDIVFDDFGKPMFRIGPKHKRVGTEYEEMFDMPVFRPKQKEDSEVGA